MNILSKLRKHVLLPALAVAVAGLAAPALGQKKVRVIGFYPVYDLTPELTDAQLDLLSHVIIFSLTPPTDGNLTGESIQKDLTNVSLVADLIERAKKKGITVMISVGGAGKSQGFAALVGNASARQKYIAGLLDLCLVEGLGGVDIDWEFPMDANGSGLAAFMKELKAAFGPKNLLISMDVQASKEVSVTGNVIGSTWTAKYPKDALTACDFVNLMAYDDDYNGGDHSSEEMAKSQANLYGTFLGSTGKVSLGVPFFGKAGFNNRKSFKEIAAQYNPAASANTAGGYNFNGVDLIARKTAYTITNNNTGVMIWDLLKDATDNRLLKATNQAIKAANAVLDLKPKPISLAPALSRDASGGLMAIGADLILSAASAGRYRLILTGLDGRMVASAMSRSGIGNTAVWSMPSLPGGRYTYKVEGKTGDVSGGQNSVFGVLTVRK